MYVYAHYIAVKRVIIPIMCVSLSSPSTLLYFEVFNLLFKCTSTYKKTANIKI